jgi:3-phenylpropionate/trans-cinnamate dioxygenase ferredoxin reductase subunit
VPGHDLAGIVSLRALADADRLRTLPRPGARIAIIGAGYIGLEVAASARILGADVVVIEREPRVLARVASIPLSDFFQRRHAAEGVRIVLNAAVEAFEGANGHVTAVRLSDGAAVPCDAVLIGVGAAPNEALARAAGLACDNGIVVDLAARTADPSIHAIGDCTRRPLPLYHRTGRLESVPNALEQAKQAGADLCGRPAPTAEVPWFWSDQYEVRLQIAGLPLEVTETVVRGDPRSGSFAIFHLSENGTVQAVEAVNAPAEFMAGRIMIARRKQAVAARLRDVSCSMREQAAYSGRGRNMPKVTYVEYNGTEHQVDVPIGTSLMRGAVDNNIPGIDADCGGECACATCHVYVDAPWLDKVGLPVPGSQEAAMLSFAAVAQPDSRLSCQLTMTEDLDGILVRMPEGQH